MKNQHHSFPSIEQFKNVRRNVEYKTQCIGLDDNSDPIFDKTKILPTLQFEGTVKLHGTNSAIVFSKDEIYCQSRERIIAPGNDNMGFATWAHSLSEDSLNIIRKNFPPDYATVVVYGEWCGKGIQKNVAISNIDKMFVIFSARLVDENDENKWLDISNWTLPDGVYNIKNYKFFTVSVDMEQPVYAIDQINKWVLEVEEECPVGKAFGYSGIGEGIVFRCITPGFESSKFWFKAKGDKHSNSKVKKLATVDVEKFKSELDFIYNVLDEGRLEQGYQWIVDKFKIADEKGIGDFIRWIFGDVLKECKLEMEKNNISEKDLGKLLAQPAKRWYISRINK